MTTCEDAILNTQNPLLQRKLGLSSYKVVVWIQRVWDLFIAEEDLKKELGTRLSPLDCEHQKDWGHVRLVPFLVHFKWTGFGSLKTNYMWKLPNTPILNIAL